MRLSQFEIYYTILMERQYASGNILDKIVFKTISIYDYHFGCIKRVFWNNNKVVMCEMHKHQKCSTCAENGSDENLAYDQIRSVSSFNHVSQFIYILNPRKAFPLTL